MALDTVQDYVTAARVLLQDTVAAYRYPDANYLRGLNFALLEARRLRADLFIGVTTVPTYATNDSTAVAFDQNFRLALIYWMAGHVQLADEEDTEDSRAATFVQMFNKILLGAMS